MRVLLALCEVKFSEKVSFVNNYQMENYSKGKNVEEPLDRSKIPIPNLPEQLVWMKVSGGSKMRNLLGYAMKVFKDEGRILWSGSGGGVSKAISCAEIMKRRFKQVHQINKICYRRVEEFWEPGKQDMDLLVVMRGVPTIHILLSKEPLDTNEPGYQGPDSDGLGAVSQMKTQRSVTQGNRMARIATEHFAALGLRSRTRQKHRNPANKPASSNDQSENTSKVADENMSS